jgi:hypothetical protein
MSAAQVEAIEVSETRFARARAHVAEVEGIVASDEMIRKPHSDLEAMLDGQGKEWARLMLEENLRLRAQLERRTEVTGADGVERVSARDSERHLETVLGRVSVQRLAYQTPGTVDLHPMDAALNLPREMFSHGIRRMVAKEAARASFDEVVEIVRDYTGSTIAKRQVEELAVRAAQDFDAFYEQRAAARDPRGDLLVISTDGKGVVMRHEDLREGTRKAAEKSVRKLETRLTPGEKSNRKRMAQVATVYSIGPFPEGPRTSSTRSAMTRPSTPSGRGQRTSECGRASRSTLGRSSARLSPRRNDGIQSTSAAGSCWSMASRNSSVA